MSTGRLDDPVVVELDDDDDEDVVDDDEDEEEDDDEALLDKDVRDERLAVPVADDCINSAAVI